MAAAVDKAVGRNRTTGQLSTQNRAGRKLLSAGPALCAHRRTDFGPAQTLVRLEEKRLVHTRAPALLLLLSIYKAIEEQPEPQLRPGAAAARRAAGCPGLAGFPTLSGHNPGPREVPPLSGLNAANAARPTHATHATHGDDFCYNKYSFVRLCNKRWSLFLDEISARTKAVYKTGDSSGTTWRLSTSRAGAPVLSPPGRQRQRGRVHRVGPHPSGRRRSGKRTCPHPGPASTTTTMYL